MYKFLIKTKDKKKIFIYKPYEGICEIDEKAGGWTEPKSICRDGSNVFFVYIDREETIHLITVTKDNRFIYMSCKNEEWHQYVICTVKEDISVKKVMIGLSPIGQNLFYSAEYQQEYILVHCVLGNNAMPYTIDKMSCDSFFVSGRKVYYSNAEGVLGFQDFSDGKPNKFNETVKGKMPYLINIKNKDYFVYKNGNRICVNGEICAEDDTAEYPIIVRNGEQTVLMWQSGDFVKYINYDNKFFNSKPMQYVSNGVRPSVYVISNGTICRYYLGSFHNNTLKIFTNADPFSKEEEIKENEYMRRQEEILQLRKCVEQLKNEIMSYRKEIQKLNMIIQSLSMQTENQNTNAEKMKNEDIAE
ncbi:MAG: bZIP transcription factor [Clostridia bacterium]|nr:bZIP transcription factor [Clostridia bacterium]